MNLLFSKKFSKVTLRRRQLAKSYQSNVALSYKKCYEKFLRRSQLRLKSVVSLRKLLAQLIESRSKLFAKRKALRARACALLKSNVGAKLVEQ
ncbi:hypothetical protein BOX15_Mlig028798g1 [Macrostomum lignano]|uniref:Uncharacterized protein n=1 Tax=Macrostomum lignano TaxID=282301 RepID=A0A267GDU6_9PLAT|nr:hypothetical protein BOX15_Mlig028798g1 [Macrostomum lignano]